MFKRTLSSLILLALAACTTVTPPPVPTPPPTSTFTPQPTSTPQPTATVMPSATPNKAPSPNWLLPTIEVQGWQMGFVNIAEWVNNTTLSVYDQKAIQEYWFDAVLGKSLPVLTPTPYIAPVGSTSPSKMYQIVCAPNSYQMWRLVDGKLISKAAIDFSDCDQIEWAPNNSAISLIDHDGKVYVWRSDGTQPFIVGKGMSRTHAIWSPDSSKMTVLAASIGESASYSIVYPDGRPMLNTSAKLDAGNGWLPYGVRWLTNDVVWNSRRCGFQCSQTSYYDALSGDFLTGQINYGYLPFGAASDILSPDQRWLVLSSATSEGEVLTFFDLSNKRRSDLVKGKGDYRLLRWSSLPCCFFFLRYPIDAQGVQVKEPAGLISYDASQMSPWLMIPNALDAQWNEHGTSIFAITFGEIDAKNKILRNVEAGIYGADGKKISALLLASEMRFEQLAYFTVPLAQSNSKNSWVVRDGSNNLWVINDKGQTKQIASGLPVDESLNTTQFSWSPDDRYLLVYRNDRAWVVDMKTVVK